MVSLAGLSAVPGGYMEARTADNANKLSEEKLQSAALDRAGDVAFGKTLQAFGVQMPGQGSMQPPPQGQPPMPPQGPPPQTMAPGQPSMPMQHPGAAPPQSPMGGPPGGQMPPSQGLPPQQMPQGGPPGAPPMGQPPQQQGGFAPQQPGTGPLSWQTIAQKIAQANPGAPPEVIARAVNRAIPLMNAQSQQEWRQIRTELDFVKEQGRNERQANTLDSRENVATQRTDTQKEIATGRNETQKATAATRAETQGKIEEGRANRFDRSEERRQASAKVREDQGYQRLQQQADAARQRVEASAGKQGLSEWRAATDAAHKRAMEVIQSYKDMPTADRKKLIQEQEANYNTQLETMRAKVGRSTPGAAGAPAETAPPKGTSKEQEKAPASPAPAFKPEAGGLPPEAAAQLKPGHVTTFGNGQKWTIENGQPKQLP